MHVLSVSTLFFQFENNVLLYVLLYITAIFVIVRTSPDLPYD